MYASCLLKVGICDSGQLYVLNMWLVESSVDLLRVSRELRQIVATHDRGGSKFIISIQVSMECYVINIFSYKRCNSKISTKIMSNRIFIDYSLI